MPKANAEGLSSIVSWGAYLDRQAPTDDTHWMMFDTWTDMYTKMLPSSVNASLGVLGGEASSWAENVDAANLDERLFHRLPAVAGPSRALAAPGPGPHSRLSLAPLSPRARRCADEPTP